MIEEITGRPEGTLEFKITGYVTADDYDTVLTPAIERALEQHDRIRLLVQIGPGFEGYSFQAAWEDSRLGLQHWRGFDRIAVVTDVGWMRTAIRALAFSLPCPVQVFQLGEHQDARRWLTESLGTIHLHELGGDALVVKLIGKLDSAAYERPAEQLDNFVAQHGRIRLLLDLRDFDGWQGLSAIGDHLSLIRDHYRAPKRVAVLGYASWQHLAERVLSRFVDAETRYFQGADIEDVEAWLKQG